MAFLAFLLEVELEKVVVQMVFKHALLLASSRRDRFVEQFICLFRLNFDIILTLFTHHIEVFRICVSISFLKENTLNSWRKGSAQRYILFEVPEIPELSLNQPVCIVYPNFVFSAAKQCIVVDERTAFHGVD
jgi:hypothetical protein